MADDELREAERAWRADEADQAALARYIAALRRAGRPVTHDLLERQVHPPRTFEAPVRLVVDVTLPDGTGRNVGSTPWKSLELPEHRDWDVSVPEEVEDWPTVWSALERNAVTRLQLILPGAEARSLLGPIGALSLEWLWLRCRGDLPPLSLEPLAALHDLAELDLIVDGALSAGHLEPLRACGSLSRVSLTFHSLGEGALDELGRWSSLRELTLERSFLRAAPELDPAGHSGRDAELAGLRPLLELRRLDLARLPWSLADAALAEVAPHHRLTSLDVSGDFSSRGVAALIGLPLESLAISSERFADDDPTAALQELPALRRLPIRRLSETGLHRLPAGLHELDTAAAHRGSLSWLERLRELRTLRLSVSGDYGDEGLRPLGSLVRLQALGLVAMNSSDGEGAVITPVALQHLSTCEELVALEVDGVDLLTPAHGEVLARLPLRRLSLEDCRLRREAVTALASSPTIEELSIGWVLSDDEPPSLDDAGLCALAALPRLKILTVRDRPGLTTQVVDAILRERPGLVIRGDI